MQASLFNWLMGWIAGISWWLAPVGLFAFYLGWNALPINHSNGEKS